MYLGPYIMYFLSGDLGIRMRSCTYRAGITHGKIGREEWLLAHMEVWLQEWIEIHVFRARMIRGYHMASPVGFLLFKYYIVSYNLIFH